MHNKVFKLTQKGYTLLELMSVLVIMGVIFSVAIKKYDLTQYTGIPSLVSNEIIRYRLYI